MTFKIAIKSIAKRHGLHATFMPKPKMGMDGSGMHTNMSLSRNGVNIFDDPSDRLGLSKEAYQFMAGIMAHIKAITAIANPLVNSYKRLVPGYEAPVYIAWSTNNRSPLIRIPSPRGEETRIELRSPDPATNPYLLLAVCLAAGLDGIKKGMTPPPRVEGNLFEMSDEERELAGIEQLPNNLANAIRELEKDEFIKNVLGKHIYKNYVKAKKEEWRQYSNQVHDWEVEQYLYKI
jgi:glutamine synthetase